MKLWYDILSSSIQSVMPTAAIAISGETTWYHLNPFIFFERTAKINVTTVKHTAPIICCNLTKLFPGVWLAKTRLEKERRQAGAQSRPLGKAASAAQNARSDIRVDQGSRRTQVQRNLRQAGRCGMAEVQELIFWRSIKTPFSWHNNHVERGFYKTWAKKASITTIFLRRISTDSSKVWTRWTSPPAPNAPDSSDKSSLFVTSDLHIR